MCQWGPCAVEGNPALAVRGVFQLGPLKHLLVACVQLFLLPLPRSVLSASFKMCVCYFTMCFFRCCCKGVIEIRAQVEDPVCTEASHTVSGFYCIGICTPFFSPSFSLCSFKAAVSFQCINGFQNHFSRSSFRNNRRFQNFDCAVVY